MKIEQIDINLVKPYVHNPRRNQKTIDAVVKSLSTFGFQQPLVVDKNNIIVVGHSRYQAAKQLNYTQVPVVYADLTEDQARAYRIMDNKTHDYTRWDIVELKYELDELEDLDLTGFSLKELDDILYPELGMVGDDVKHNIKHHVVIECKSEEDIEIIGELINQKGYKNWKKNQY